MKPNLKYFSKYEIHTHLILLKFFFQKMVYKLLCINHLMVFFRKSPSKWYVPNYTWIHQFNQLRTTEAKFHYKSCPLTYQVVSTCSSLLNRAYEVENCFTGFSPVSKITRCLSSNERKGNWISRGIRIWLHLRWSLGLAFEQELICSLCSSIKALIIN